MYPGPRHTLLTTTKKTIKVNLVLFVDIEGNELRTEQRFQDEAGHYALWTFSSPSTEKLNSSI
jgi:hypothetical protein